MERYFVTDFNQVDDQNQTVIMHYLRLYNDSAWVKYLEMIEYLIKNTNVDLMREDNQGQTALEYA